MAKEALLEIKKSEDEVNALLSEAQKLAKETIANSHVEGKDKASAIIEEGKSKAKQIMDDAEKQGHKDAEPILKNGMAEVESIKNLDSSKINEAVELVVERIVNNNGNC